MGGGTNAEGSPLVNSRTTISEQTDSPIHSTSPGASEDPDGFWQTRPRQQTNTSLIASEDNCTVLKNDSFGNILKNLKESGEDYTIISCGNEGTSFKTKWTAFFPNNLIEKNVKEGEKLTITADKEDIEEEEYEEEDDFDANYKTTFSGRVFYGKSLIGYWGNKTKDVDEKNLTIFRSEDDGEEFYLLFGEGQQHSN